jgi:divalent anion:Na+ symporter, DASS family
MTILLKVPYFDWIHFTMASIVTALAIFLITLLSTYFMYPPELNIIDNKALTAKGLTELGPMKREEKTLCVLFVLAVLGWAVGGFFKIDANALLLSPL